MKVEYSGIRRAIHHLEQAKKRYTDKFHNILDEIAQAGYEVASARFDSAAYAGNPQVDVHIEWDGDYSVSVIAEGESVLFIEFGSGVSYPESEYASNFPEIVPHGQYGSKKGANPKGWIYQGEKGTGDLAFPVKRTRKDGSEVVREGVWRTWGNPPANAMYEASKKMHDQVERIIERGLK